MNDHSSEHRHEPPASPAGGWSREKIVLVGFLVVAGFYLFTEHRAHLYGALPWLLLAACPLMHLFMHGGHGGSHNHGGNEAGDRKSVAPDQPSKPNKGAAS